MIFRSFLVILLLSFFSINFANAVSIKGAGGVLKVISEAFEEASAVKTAVKTEQAVQVVNEANVVKKEGFYTPKIQVLFGTTRIIKECEKAKKNPDNGLCSQKFNTCVEAGLYAGYETEEAIKQCKAGLN